MEISVVDQSPIFTNTNADQAIKDSVELAQYSDQIGLKRFWLAEHHGSNSFAGCSPEILIPRIASSTKNIRVGSGGVMLMHYSPYKVAENFRLLESMFPRRIDLGLGRAPGSDPFQAGALAYGSKTTGPEFFPTKMNDLRSFLSNQTPETKSFENVNVLDHISFQLALGERVSLIGPGGGGKSILLKILIGLLKPDKGTCFISGVDMFKDKEKQRREVLKKTGMSVSMYAGIPKKKNNTLLKLSFFK